MRLPRDIGSQDLARRLASYGYTVTRQTGKHVKLTSSQTGREHQITVTTSLPLRMATVNNILIEVAGYLAMEKDVLTACLFAP